MPCIEKLNDFYQLKNHVQRAHSVFFQQPVIRRNADRNRLPNQPAEVNSRPVVSIERTNVAEALAKLQKTRSTIVTQAKPKTDQFRRAYNGAGPSSSSQGQELATVPAIENGRELPVINYINPIAISSARVNPLQRVKQEPETVQRRGRQRGPVGQLIFKDEATNL
jgi:hypothetical protein